MKRRRDCRALGRFGECLAQDFLQRHGYRIVEHNAHRRVGELDIVAQDPSGQLVFVEVKLRTTTHCGWPEEAISARKQQALKQASLDYLACYPGSLPADEYRFDLITLLVDSLQKKILIKHYKSIF